MFLAASAREVKATFTSRSTNGRFQKGGIHGRSDVYDYFDLGKYEQKGTIRTWFGSEEELRELIRGAHQHHLRVYADLVINHNNGADQQELNPIINQYRWTLFTPMSKMFTRDWTCFNPSPYPELNSSTFGDMPDLCHINPRVSTGILNHAKWMIQDIGFDGFRYDFVKGFGAWVVRAIHDRHYSRDGEPVEIFGVGECWAGHDYIDIWLDAVNNWAATQTCTYIYTAKGTGLLDRALLATAGSEGSDRK